MTWYDGGPPPDPRRPVPDARHAVPEMRAGVPEAGTGGAGVRGDETGGRARLRAAAERASAADGSGSGDPSPGRRRARHRPSGLRWHVRPRTAGLAVLVLALVGGAVALRTGAPSGPAVEIPEPAASAATGPHVPSGATEQPGPQAADPAAVVWVHVVGQVATPGLVSLPPGSRVAEAVAAAGGALPDADLAAVNLAAPVVDGAQVRVPAPGEQAPAVAEVPGTSSGGAPGLVDVNTASAAELETLPGIGPVLAERIVAWRSEHGAFADVDALQDVPGIGPSVLAQLRERVRT